MCRPIKVYKANLENGINEIDQNQFDIVFSKSLIEHLVKPLNFLKSYNKQFKKTDCKYVLFTDCNELIKAESHYEDKISQNLINELRDDLLIVIN